MAEKAKDLTIEEIKKAVVKVCSNYNVAKAALIGSRAEGTNRPDSDVDLIMEFDGLCSLVDVIEMRDTLSKMLDRPVDITHGVVRQRKYFEIGRQILLYAMDDKDILMPIEQEE
ncbi:MAG: nucleotidyltransferase domain-containing protein [Eubacteriales bacterium]|nr:nucleotidyltransferase domain-containing protein [Eubacteriales bacterium]